jgi:small subunit ribosomal protein S16
MAVRIRLKRMGSKRRPFYRFVVVDSRGKRDGGFLDQIGYYNPIAEPYEIEVDEEKVFSWLGKGAQMSDGARDLLKKVGILNKWDVKRGKAPAAVPAAAPEPEAEAVTEARVEPEPETETKAAAEVEPEPEAETGADEKQVASGTEEPEDKP